MMSKSIESQAREYVFDLKNCASEYGQNTYEGWEFSLVSDVEKKKIEKDYYPTISANPAKESLFELLRLVKEKLMLPLKSAEYSFDVESTAYKSLTHLIAFNQKLHR